MSRSSSTIRTECVSVAAPSDAELQRAVRMAVWYRLRKAKLYGNPSPPTEIASWISDPGHADEDICSKATAAQNDGDYGYEPALNRSASSLAPDTLERIDRFRIFSTDLTSELWL